MQGRKPLTAAEKRKQDLAAQVALLHVPVPKTVRVKYVDPTERSEESWKIANPDRKKGELWMGPSIK